MDGVTQVIKADVGSTDYGFGLAVQTQFQPGRSIPVQIKSSTFDDSFEDDYLGEREVT